MENKIATDKFQKAQESLVTQQSDFSLKTIEQMVIGKAIDLAPHYQRRDRWTNDKQSALIESFILNVPVPPVYLSEEEYGNYSVIDGKQRITSISNFLGDKFKLTDLKKFPELNGLTFSQLPQTIINALSIRPYVRVVTLLRQSDPNLKYEVFLRLNTGGEDLTPQEIRNVAYSGSLNDLLFELSENPILRHKLKITDEKSNAFKKMSDIEHVLRFFTLRSKWATMGGFLADEMDLFMLENRKLDSTTISYLRKIFNTAIERCNTIWPHTAFCKPIENGWREQLISPLYDAQMVSVSFLTEIQFQSILSKPVVQRKKIIEDLYSELDFNKAVSQATNNRSNVRLRIQRLMDSLQTLV